MSVNRRRWFRNLALVCLLLAFCPFVSFSKTNPERGQTVSQTRIKVGLPFSPWLDYEATTVEKRIQGDVNTMPGLTIKDAKPSADAPPPSITSVSFNRSYNYNVNVLSWSWLFLIAAIVLFMLRGPQPKPGKGEEPSLATDSPAVAAPPE